MKNRRWLRFTAYIALLTSCIMLGTQAARGQVLNFDVPGGVSGFANFSGQGAYADPGNNYWNAIVANGTTSSCLLSDGVTSSPITLTVSSDSVYTTGGQGAQGQPSGLQSPFYDSKPGPKTCTLNNIPAGSYQLYLYGINGDSGDCNRGTIFTVGEQTLSTVNSLSAYNTYVLNNDYVVFNVVVGPGSGSITFTYQANTSVLVSGVANNIGNFNGLQLVASNFVGAGTPFTTYEAEAGTLGGGASVVSLTAPPTTKFSSPQLEASGHSYVQLTGAGQSLTWTNNTGQAITAVNIRACVPPTSDGNGASYTLDLYVNGSFRQAMTFNSSQTWVYESSSAYNGMSRTTSGGTYPDPHVFWDEYPVFISGAALPPGGAIMLKVDSSNTASFYYIDCIDLETPPAPLAQPANSLSIISYGAQVNNSSFDNSTAIANCISAAQSGGQSVWIPQGVFYITSGTVFHPNSITIGGAGPWYSQIVDTSNSWSNGFRFDSVSTSFQNFSINFTKPNATPGISAFLQYGNNWTINNIWARHCMLSWGTGNNIVVENSRVNNSWGDGLNLNNDNGTSVTGVTIQNNFSRGNGDDAIAINNTDTNAGAPVTTNVLVANNTSGCSWWGNSLAIYGGSNITVINNLAHDAIKEDGLYVGVFDNGNALSGALVQNNTVLRGGSFGYGIQMHGMIIGSSEEPVSNVTAIGNTIDHAMFVGIGVQSSSNTVLENNLVNAAGLDGIDISSGSTGNATLDNNYVTNVASGHSQYANLAGQTSFPVILKNEGEFLTVEAITAGLANSIVTASQFSNGEAAYVNCSAIGNQVTYVVPSIPAGSYNVTVGVKKINTRGIWQLAIGPAGGSFTNFGSPQDEYSSTATYTSFNLGTWSPGSSSDKWFRFTITGKNLSSTGYDVAIDYIQLTPQ